MISSRTTFQNTHPMRQKNVVETNCETISSSQNRFFGEEDKKQLVCPNLYRVMLPMDSQNSCGSPDGGNANRDSKTPDLQRRVCKKRCGGKVRGGGFEIFEI